MLANKHGKTWGVYEGASPVVYTVDTDLIKEIFVKKFDYFPERMALDVPEEARTLDVLYGEPWKYLRKSFTPAFTSGKIKAMLSPIQDVVSKVKEHLNHQSSTSSVFSSQPFHILYHSFTSSVWNNFSGFRIYFLPWLNYIFIFEVFSSMF